MNSKIKKIMLLTTGLAGGLLATSIAGITLSSCTFQVQQDPNNNNNNNQGNSGSTNQGTTTSPKDELTYNPNANYYTTQIFFDAKGKITNASANTLTISDTGLIFADPAMTTLIGIMPNVETSNITIPASVKAITGYQAAVVYDTGTGKIVNPTFSATNGATTRGITVGNGQTLLDLGSVGAFQKVNITDGSNATGSVTPPTMTATGLSTLTTINFANNSQLQTIGPKAFLGCSNLKTVNLPDSTNTIGAEAFQNCTNLQTINLKGVSYIGDAAFNNAFIAPNSALATENPVSLDLTSAQYIGTGAFDSSVWTKSSSTRAASTNTLVQASPGENGATETQKNLSKISAISFSKPLTTLSDYAFNGANYLLKSVDLSSCTSLASIGNNAFSNTTNLADVKFSPTIGNIGNRAFSGAPLANTLTFNTNTDLTIGQNAFDTQQLTTIDFSNVKGNITIGNSAFSGSNQNTSLTTLTLPAGPTEAEPNMKNIVMIGQSAFGNCSNLTLPGFDAANAATYSLPANIGYLGNNAFSSATLGKLTSGLKYNANFTVTNELTNVANGLFAGITNGSTYFGPLTGNNNTSLTSVDLSNTNIQALNYGNVSQSGLTTPSTSIPIRGTFNGASNLTEITLPASCNQFGIAAFADFHATQYGAFSNCSSLTNLNFKNFKLNTEPDAAGVAPTGFDQITQDTWVQVANIMNALMYFGQQNIQANSDVENSTITNQTQMDAITYTVNADPVATNGTWHADGTDANSAFNQFGNHMDAALATTTNGFNYPINVYPAGSYGYSVEAGDAGRAGTPVTVNYPAGLGTSVSANFKDSAGNAASPSTSVTIANGGSGSLGFGASNANGPLMNGSGSNPDTNVVFNTKVTNAGGVEIANQATITLTENSTRPQSVWYTVSASGTVGDATPGTSTTQKLYELTPDESNNIFAVKSGYIAGATNSGNGGYGYGMGRASGSSFNQTANMYTTVVSGKTIAATQFGNPFAEPNKGNLQTNNATARSNTITLSQNYLPLGITANVKDAYFNHNGIIWHYHNGFAPGSDNKGIFIEGYVNAYIGGSIQPQGNGIGGLADGQNSDGAGATTGNSVLTNDTSLAAGVYKNGAGLTSVDGTPLQTSNFPGPGNDNKIQNNLNPTIGLFGGKVNNNGSVASSTEYSYEVGPANVQVKLILVSNSTSNSGGQN